MPEASAPAPPAGPELGVTTPPTRQGGTDRGDSAVRAVAEALCSPQGEYGDYYVSPDLEGQRRADRMAAVAVAAYRQWRADERERAESAPWLLDLVHAAETAAEELGCNGDHEGHEGCDGCAWEALADAVPARVRNAADERASRP